MNASLPPEPEGWGAGREWTWRCKPTAANPNGLTTQGLRMSEAAAREKVAERNAHGGVNWTHTVVYRDISAWTEVSAIRAGEPRALLLKCRREDDFYVAWSTIAEAPLWCGDRAGAAAFGYTEERIARADEFGTSSTPYLDVEGTKPWHSKFYAWDSDGMIAEQRGYLLRRYLRAYALLYAAGELQAAFDLLEPLATLGIPDCPQVRRH